MRDRRRAAGAGAQRDSPGVLRNAQAAGARRHRRRQHRRRAASPAAAAARTTCCRKASTCTSSGSPTAGGSSCTPMASTWPTGRKRSRPRGGRMTPQALRDAVAKLELTNAALVDCTADAVGRRRVSGVHRREPAHHHAEQAGERAAVAALSALMDAARAPAEALPLRGERRRRAARHVDAARPDRERRRDRQDRRHPVGHAELPVQHVRRQRAVQRAGAQARTSWGSPSPIRARICPGRTSRASC